MTAPMKERKNYFGKVFTIVVLQLTLGNTGNAVIGETLSEDVPEETHTSLKWAAQNRLPECLCKDHDDDETDPGQTRREASASAS